MTLDTAAVTMAALPMEAKAALTTRLAGAPQDPVQEIVQQATARQPVAAMVTAAAAAAAVLAAAVLLAAGTSLRRGTPGQCTHGSSSCSSEERAVGWAASIHLNLRFGATSAAFLPAWWQPHHPRAGSPPAGGGGWRCGACCPAAASQPFRSQAFCDVRLCCSVLSRFALQLYVPCSSFD